MRSKIILTFLTLMLLQMLLVGCKNKVDAPLVGQIDNDSLTLLITKEKIQTGLNSLLTSSKQNFIIYSVDIIDYQSNYFLEVKGVSNQKCMIALKEYKGMLYELNENRVPIVICTGCDEACDPKLTENGWYCSEGCSTCEKSSAISDSYVFE